MPIRHGIFVNEPVEGVRAINEIATAVIGLAATAPDADPDLFPLDKPVLVTDVRSALGVVGDTGTLPGALAAIADQTSPIIVVSRVEVAADPGDQEELVIGTTEDGAYTGIKALLAAKSQLGVQPRILGIPGLDSGMASQALATAARNLNGMAYIHCAGAENVSQAILQRDDYSQREAMLLWPETSRGGGDVVARALGLRAYIDQTVGWHKTLSNVAVQGISGLDVPVHFDLHSMENDAGLLNQSNITTLVRMNGFRFWGNRTCSDEPLFAFESAVRTAQVLRDSIGDSLIWAVDKPISNGLIRDIVETINAKFRQLVTQGRIIGGNAWFDPSANTSDLLSQGKLTIDYDYTPCAPAEDITLNQRITDKYYANVGNALAA